MEKLIPFSGTKDERTDITSPAALNLRILQILRADNENPIFFFFFAFPVLYPESRILCFYSFW